MCLLFGLLVLIVGCEATSEPEQRCELGDTSRGLGERWKEGNQLCKCIFPESLLYFWDGQNPSPPIKRCLNNGCPARKGRFVKSGRAFKKGSDVCICRKGSDPNLADANTLYHAICFNPNSGYTTNFDYQK